MAANKRTTGKKASSNASKTLSSKSTGRATKKSSGSALSQTETPRRQTGKSAASAASKTFRDGRTSKASKSAAGSTLAQTPSSKSGRKVPQTPKTGKVTRGASKQAVKKVTSRRSSKKKK